MNKRLIIILLAILSYSQLVNSQSNQDKARAYFMEAKSNFEQQEYNDALKNLDKVKEILGASNPMTLSLRYKTYYKLKDYKNAKKFLNDFFKKSQNASQDLKNEATSYIIKIDEAIVREKKRIEQERLAEIERKKRAEIAAAKRKEELRLEKIRRERQKQREKEIREENAEKKRKLLKLLSNIISEINSNKFKFTKETGSNMYSIDYVGTNAGIKKLNDQSLAYWMSKAYETELRSKEGRANYYQRKLIERKNWIKAWNIETDIIPVYQNKVSHSSNYPAGHFYFSKVYNNLVCYTNKGGDKLLDVKLNRLSKQIRDSNYSEGYIGYCGWFSNGVAWMQFNRLRYGFEFAFINKQGDLQFTVEKADYINPFWEDMAVIKWGGNAKMVSIIDNKGKLIAINSKGIFKQDHIYFSEDLLGVIRCKKNCKKGFIDKTGNVIIPFKYDEIKPFDKGVAYVKRKSQWYKINNKGDVLEKVSAPN